MLVGALVFVSTILRTVAYSPEAEVIVPPTTTPSSIPAPLPGEYPARLAIPSLNIDAAVQHLGLVAGNRMQAPAGFADAGWFKYGTVPGEPGTAVMYGHYDNGLGLPGVFKHLSDIQIGDLVIATTKDGEKRTFRVVSKQTYPYQAVPQSVLGETSDDAPRISLITCAGKGIRDDSIGFTYDERLVVMTELVS